MVKIRWIIASMLLFVAVNYSYSQMDEESNAFKISIIDNDSDKSFKLEVTGEEVTYIEILKNISDMELVEKIDVDDTVLYSSSLPPDRYIIVFKNNEGIAVYAEIIVIN